MEPTQDNRREFRLTGEFTVFLETLSAPPEQDFQSHVVICNTMDISSNGIGLILDEPLALGIILQMYIEISDSKERFLLVAEVKWCQPSTEDEDCFNTGFELYESDGTNIIEWKKLVSRKLFP